ncbi:unnamed protein product [Peniophora sp. CBMAI 1063]|nr:unnamed protein product [Peniophora sp. CBMAI 1063]
MVEYTGFAYVASDEDEDDQRHASEQGFIGTAIFDSHPHRPASSSPNFDGILRPGWLTITDDMKPRLLHLHNAPSLSARERIFPQRSPNGAYLWTPADLFKPGSPPGGPENDHARWRYIGALNNETTALVFADGRCKRNGYMDADGSMLVQYSPRGHENSGGSLHERLHVYNEENHENEDERDTSNRAKLAAVSMALAWADLLYGKQLGFDHLVIATNSEYVEMGARQLRTWISNGWRNSRGTRPKNQQLWYDFAERLAKLESTGLRVSFWRVKLRRDNSGHIEFE